MGAPPGRDKSEALLRAFGRMIEQLGGEFQTGEDVGTTLGDMEVVYSETDHVVTLPVHCGAPAISPPATALGSVQAMRACLKRASGSPDLGGRQVALQGLGALGITQHKLAVAIGVPPRRINEIVHGTRRTSADTALRLARYFGTTERFWMNLQGRYDLEAERDRLASVLEEIRPLVNA